MVDQTVSHARRVVNDGDAVAPELGRQPDTREHQELRRGERPRRDEDLTGRARGRTPAAAEVLDAGRPAAVEDDARRPAR